VADRPAILAEGISKSFGDVHALDDVSLGVDAGTVLGMLGPNGAGKTTAVRIFTTLLRPDAGHAEVAGYDVVKDAVPLRTAIGLAGQYAAVDEHLTGRENLEMVGRLYHLDRLEARRRADALLERFALSAAAHRVVRTYSGGMRRRLDLGASLIGRPQVLFLDEPTTGLDPRGRIEMWDVIKDLVSDGTTLLLTTQYLEEADRIADLIAVIDGGHVIAQGTADQLKAHVGGDQLEFRVPDRARLGEAAGIVVGLGTGSPQVDNQTGQILMPVGEHGGTVLAELVRRLDAEGIEISDLALRRPTLDEVFLTLTGHGAEEVAEDPAQRGRRRKKARGDGSQEVAS
jgi:ABC-2 type transport system ATP-binding protein